MVICADGSGMFGRVVSLCLLPCLLLTQSVAMFGHAHAGLRLPGHDIRPHVHANLTSSDHGHHHGPSGHRHGHGDDALEPALLVEQSSQPEPLPGHDSDAVFVACVDVFPGERASANAGMASPPLWDAAGSCSLDSTSKTLTDGTGDRRHAPPSSRYSCPIYVRHLALLI